MPLRSTAVSHTMAALCTVTNELPIGTNLGLLHFLWMQVSGVDDRTVQQPEKGQGEAQAEGQGDGE